MDGIGSVMDDIMGNSIVAWIMSKLQNLVDLIVQINAPDATAAMREAPARLPDSPGVRA